jgi:hypothetical protein
LLALVLIFGVLIIGIWIVGIAFDLLRPVSALSALQEGEPGLGALPEELPDHGVAILSGEQHDRLGLSFQAPWKEIDHEEAWKDIGILHFKNGANLMFRETQIPLDVKIFRMDPRFETMLGKDQLRSNYDLMAASMRATPDRVKWWHWPSANQRDFLLLAFKSGELHKSEKIYSISTERMRGFQTGSPVVAPYNVTLELYDASDRHFELMLMNAEASKPVWTQPEINALVASMRPAQ